MPKHYHKRKLQSKYILQAVVLKKKASAPKKTPCHCSGYKAATKYYKHPIDRKRFLRDRYYRGVIMMNVPTEHAYKNPCKHGYKHFHKHHNY